MVHRKVYVRVPSGQGATRVQAPRAKAAPQKRTVRVGAQAAALPDGRRAGAAAPQGRCERPEGQVEDLMSTIEIVERRWRTTLAVTLPGSADAASCPPG